MLENRGYDIGPFIYFLHDINLKEYDVVYKIHSKSQKTSFGKIWGKQLLDAILKNKQVVNNTLEKLKEKHIGMVGSKKHVLDDGLLSLLTDRVAFYQAIKILQNNRIKIKSGKFIAGTMFAVKANLMQIVKDCVSFEDFPKMQKYQPNGTFSHGVERFLGLVIYAQGYEVYGVGDIVKKKKSLPSKIFKHIKYGVPYSSYHIRITAYNLKLFVLNLFKK